MGDRVRPQAFRDRSTWASGASNGNTCTVEEFDQLSVVIYCISSPDADEVHVWTGGSQPGRIGATAIRGVRAACPLSSLWADFPRLNVTFFFLILRLRRR